jgi:sulfonate transport system ATP-binding protein
MPAVEVRGLRQRFGSRIVLDGLDLTIQDGEFVALIGRSGGGKTTLLRTLAGLQPVDEGHVEVAAVRSIVFQEPRLLPWRSVAANVAVGLKRDERARAATALEEVGLGAFGDVWPGTLSGGEAQRAALARALVREPRLLLLDEPFGALDALTRLNMHRLVRELQIRHRPAVLLVTHDVDEALTLGDRVMLLREGRLEHQIETHSLFNDRLDPGFEQARTQLLTLLGVDNDTAESGAHQ